MFIGKIAKSDSHIIYVCRVYGPREVEAEPLPTDYAFGRFVRIAIRSALSLHPEANQPPVYGKNNESANYAVGVIYDTILLNPTFGSLGPRLYNESQVEIFSPDYLSEKATLIYVLALGTIEQFVSEDGATKVLVSQGVPLPTLDLGSEVEIMTDEDVRAFHLFSDDVTNNAAQYIHMGYLPHIIAQQNTLLPLVMLRIVEQLEGLFPQNRTLLSIIKRNFAWRLKVETAG
jgi:hypothetical protein